MRCASSMSGCRARRPGRSAERTARRRRDTTARAPSRTASDADSKPRILAKLPAVARTRASSTDGADALAAPMPATVVKIEVAPGQTVTKDSLLVMLEAMKMELPIRAPRDGRVTAIHCRVGEIVQPGVPLLDVS